MLVTSLGGVRTELEFIFNDCSIHGQFREIAEFREALARVMTIREVARNFGKNLQCHRNVAYALVTPESTMQSAVQALSNAQRSAVMQWLNRGGPFWEDSRQHSDQDDLLECDGEVVTNTAVGEAAYCIAHGIDRSLVSLNPSCWLTSPLSTIWYGDGFERSVDVPNYWDLDVVREALRASPVPPESWKQLESMVIRRCSDLTFANNSFAPLEGHPYGIRTAERLLILFDVLQTIKTCFNARGERTPEGHVLYQKHFTGEKAWFSDSSDDEKSMFRTGLTFPHPTNSDQWLSCTWHGKVKSPQLRIHFSWPIRAREPLYIVYVGPKITKR